MLVYQGVTVIYSGDMARKKDSKKEEKLTIISGNDINSFGDDIIPNQLDG